MSPKYLNATPITRNKKLANHITNHFLDRNGNNSNDIMNIKWDEEKKQWVIHHQ